MIVLIGLATKSYAYSGHGLSPRNIALSYFHRENDLEKEGHPETGEIPHAPQNRSTH